MHNANTLLGDSSMQYRVQPHVLNGCHNWDTPKNKTPSLYLSLILNHWFLEKIGISILGLRHELLDISPSKVCSGSLSFKKDPPCMIPYMTTPWTSPGFSRIFSGGSPRYPRHNQSEAYSTLFRNKVREGMRMDDDDSQLEWLWSVSSQREYSSSGLTFCRSYSRKLYI
jgi:hypothetical protein